MSKIKIKLINIIYNFVLLNIFTAQNILGNTAGDTAKFCLFFDKLFDSVNGNFDKVVDGKIYRSGVKKNSPYHKLWEESESFEICESFY